MNYIKGKNPLEKITTFQLIKELYLRQQGLILTTALAATWTWILIRATN